MSLLRSKSNTLVFFQKWCSNWCSSSASPQHLPAPAVLIELMSVFVFSRRGSRTKSRAQFLCCTWCLEILRLFLVVNTVARLVQSASFCDRETGRLLSVENKLLNTHTRTQESTGYLTKCSRTPSQQQTADAVCWLQTSWFCDAQDWHGGVWFRSL